MRLTKQSGYAVRIVTHCALVQGELVRIADIAKRYGITKNNIAKTVPVLVRNGIIEGVRGRNGGIRLVRPASDVSIGEIVRAIEATAVEAESFGGEKSGSGSKTTVPINQMLDAALEAFVSVLDQHTIEDMLPDGKKSKIAGFTKISGKGTARRPKVRRGSARKRRGERTSTSV
ncbi:MAG: Rrf2 family transcriptional regulator [Hyphomicrobiaceae bacterium]|nr:Rrf2 family transcriptional regulator [Hyphomicrobiaceae bacterium]